MKMRMAEFSGRRAGYFRPKPVCKLPKQCPRCGSTTHIGRTTCEVKPLPYPDPTVEDHRVWTEDENSGGGWK